MTTRPYDPAGTPCVVCHWQLAHIDADTGICRTCKGKATRKRNEQAATEATARQRVDEWNAHWDAVRLASTTVTDHITITVADARQLFSLAINTDSRTPDEQDAVRRLAVQLDTVSPPEYAGNQREVITSWFADMVARHGSVT